MNEPRDSAEAENFELVSCALCGNNSPKPVSERGQFNLPCNVAICQHDGLVFLSPRWTRERYLRFYQSEYDTYYRPEVLATEDDESRFRNVKTIHSRLAAINQMDGVRSVLDVGAGMGWSLEWLRRNVSGLESLAAIEPSNHCVKNLTEVVGAQVVCGDVDSAWDLSGCDLIIMRHVLEHFLDPASVLEKAAAAMASTGILYVAVPNMMRPKGSLNRYWFRSVHTYYFSAATLTQLANRAGLGVVTINDSGHELWAVLKRDDRQTANRESMNVYHRQLSVIRRHRVLRSPRDMAGAIKRAVLGKS